jgi:type IV pilus biogenesis protein PilP
MTHSHPRNVLALAASLYLAAAMNAHAQPAFMMPPTPPASLPAQESPAPSPATQLTPMSSPVVLTPGPTPNETASVKPAAVNAPTVRQAPEPISMAPSDLIAPPDDCPTEPKLRVLCEHAWQMRVLEMQKERETFQFEIEKTRRDRLIRTQAQNPTPPAPSTPAPAAPAATPQPAPAPIAPTPRAQKIEPMPEPLPTTSRIMAINGKFSATLRMPNGSVLDIRPGDAIANGWRVSSITAEAVSITKGRDTAKLASTPRILTPTSTGFGVESAPLAPPPGVNAAPVQAPTYTLLPMNGSGTN